MAVFVFGIILCLVLSAFFSGIEIAFVSANKLKIELLNKQGTRSGKILSTFVQNPSHFLGTLLIGNNIALVVFGKLFYDLLEPQFEFVHSELLILLLITVLSTIIVLIVGEFIPKILFRVNPDGVLAFFAFPLLVIHYGLYVFVLFTVTIAKQILSKVFGIEMGESKPIFNKYDLEMLLKNGNEEENDIDQELFENALYLNTIKVRECMIPRTEIEGIDIRDGLEGLKNAFIETKLSRLIIFQDNIDEVLGYVHHHELLKTPKNIRQIIRKITIVTGSMAAKELLDIFIKNNQSIAWVVDEYGGTDGLVTMEDILEEIFGEIEDEHDIEEFIEEQLSDDEYIFSGRLEVDYLNEKYNLNIPEGDYETLAGFIVTSHESIPEMQEKIALGNFIFNILSVSDKKIDTIKLHKLTSDDELLG